jgi:predicted RecA/RadA family phage recombinase
MAYTIDRAGFQQIADTSTTKNHPLGTIVKGHDPTYGEGEFIYLIGVASTAVGSIVSYHVSHQTALSGAGAAVSQPLAVAMSANGAASYGWYQISGVAVVAKSSAVSFAAGAAVGGATGGLAAAAATSNAIAGAVVAAVASATSGGTSVTVMINRPRLSET